VSPADAWRQIEQWLACESAWIPVPGEASDDLRLAPPALAIEHGLTCCSTDGDFARFPGLKWENPLAAKS
jgi:predicted nucleic acid-binding protein